MTTRPGTSGLWQCSDWTGRSERKTAWISGKANFLFHNSRVDLSYREHFGHNFVEVFHDLIVGPLLTTSVVCGLDDIAVSHRH